MRHLYFYLFISLFFHTFTLKSQVNVQDSLALVEIYNSTDGPNWMISWDLNSPINEWEGILLTPNGIHIKQIILKNNKLKGELNFLIGSLPELTHFNIENNGDIEAIHLQGIQNILTDFNCNGNKLEVLPEALFDITSLKNLNCKNNNLSSIPQRINNLSNLLQFNFSNNISITSLPNLDNLINLRQLFLTDCSLETLPELNSLVSLIGLYVRQNKLKCLPNLDSLENLTALSVANNALEKLPNFSNLTNISQLDFRNNALTDIPDISNLENLVIVNVSRNNLSFAILEEILKHPNYDPDNFAMLNQTLPEIPLISPDTTLIYYPDTLDISYSIGRTYIDSTMVLSVNHVGGDSTYYTWKKDGVKLKSSQDTIFELEDIVVDNRGVYTCEVTNTLLTSIQQNSNILDVYVYGVDSLGGVYYPNEYVIQFKNPIYNWAEKDSLRKVFEAELLDSCMCGQQLELWRLPDYIELDIDGETQTVHDDNTKRKRVRNRSKLNGCDYNYIIKNDGFNKTKKRTSYYNQLKQNRGTLKVAILDTGLDVFDEGSALRAFRWTNSDEDGTDSDKNCYKQDVHGAYIEQRDSIPDDDHFISRHGSNMAHLIIDGLNEGDVELIAVKTHDFQGWGSLFESVCGTYYAKEQGAKIINASWSYKGEPSAILRNAIKIDSSRIDGIVQQDDILFITSAGNGGEELFVEDTLYYPASYDLENIVSVMAVDNEDNIPLFSNFGFNHIDLAARGRDIPNAYGGDSLQGTSMSTAFVTGFATRLMIQYPDLTYSALKDSIFARLQYPPNLDGKCATNGRLPTYYYEDIEFINFKAEGFQDRVLLKWNTAFEKQMVGYDIETSEDGTNYTKVGAVEAKNQSINVYQFIDWCPRAAGDRYYRLIINSSTDSRFSNIEKVNIAENDALFSILGNLVEKELSIVFRNNVPTGKLLLYDSAGRLFLEQNFQGDKGTQIDINVEHFPIGLYIGKIISEDIDKVFKFQKY